ncbi:endonuclease domain-containing protein [Novosphingobium gossypii]|uniref:endonuclease domain-containing protein n=1 Tax=Novosphingobium gossypii TaxID=1604774 RepID=UPI003D23F8C0
MRERGFPILPRRGRGTTAQRSLWRLLRCRPLRRQFRRQHPIGSYVADFYCDSAKTIIEVDGPSHDMGDRPQHDLRLDEWMRAKGLRVLRIPAALVLRNPQEAAFWTACAASPPPSALRATTSPTRGGSSGVV